MGDVNREHIIAGIDAARSKIDAIEVDYKYHVQENGEVRKRLAEVHVQRALADGTMSKKLFQNLHFTCASLLTQRIAAANS